MSKQVILMLSSMLAFVICVLLAGYSYAENIGNGSWNENIFICSCIGMVVSLGLFFLGLIWAIVRGLLGK